jgi:hypothetical protein
MRILAIDPGNIESAFVIWDGNIIFRIGKLKNEDLLIMFNSCVYDNCVIEMIDSYGMPVGQEVFDTCVWIGRFYEFLTPRIDNKISLIKRGEVKLHLCESRRAKDSNIMQTLIDRFGDVNKHGKYSKGTKKDPGFFYGFVADEWAAFALAVTYFDNLKR